jgi:hypothetical protein
MSNENHAAKNRELQVCPTVIFLFQAAVLQQLAEAERPGMTDAMDVIAFDRTSEDPRLRWMVSRAIEDAPPFWPT